MPVGTPNSENQHPISFGGSTLANSNPSTHSRVPARRIIPGNPNQSQVAVQSALGKCTFAQTQPPGEAHISGSSVTQANPTKRARNVGPIHSCPMPLVLPSERGLGIPETSNNRNKREEMDDSVVKGKGKRLECTSSFYLGRGNHSHPLTRLDPSHSTFHIPNVDDDGSLTEDDPIDDDHTVKLTLKFPNKFSKSLAIEASLYIELNRPSWSSSSGSELANSASQSSSTSVHDAYWATVNSLLSLSLPEFDLGSVPALLPGSNKLKLTNQCPVVHTVLHESIELLQAAMLFNHGFPDVCVALGLIKDCLLTAADQLNPISVDVLDRLKWDADYVLRITPLPCAWISLIRSEVKECLTIITMGLLLAFGSPLDTINYVQKKLSHYTYTFLKAKLTNAPNALVMRLRLYRHDRIINVIWALYFARGTKSSAK
ncbi:hypothetical protein EI94DRAFT_1698593 [Lactarius quietus]|nr:hypothetical protein EI94DRAFT_1698593 [Lactarius quietus]